MNFLTRLVRICLSRLRRSPAAPGHDIYEPTGVRIEAVERTVVLGRGVLSVRILGPNAYDSATLRITVDGAALVRMDVDQELRAVESPPLTPLGELPLRPRVRLALANEGVATVEDLVALSPADVMSIPNLGAVALIEIKTALAAEGRTLRAGRPARAEERR